MLRTRMQSEIFRNSSSAHYDKKYGHGLFSMFKNVHHIVNTEGFLALYKGLGPSMLGVFHPFIFFPLYEKSKIYFMKNHE